MKLPIGQTITRLKYYHLGEADKTVHTVVKLMRKKMGYATNTVAWVESVNNDGRICELTTSTINSPVIERGYIYCVVVDFLNSSSEIHGIRIHYRE